MASLPAPLVQLLEEFATQPDRRRRMMALIALGRKLPAMPPEHKNAQTLVPGCVSEVHLHATTKDGRLYFEGDADSLLLRGLVYILVTGLSGLTPQEIQAVPADFITQTGLSQSVSPSRSNGFYNLFRKLQEYASSAEGPRQR